MPDNYGLVSAKDTRYTFNGYGATTGLQRFDYNYAANEEHHDEIGNINHAATSFRPETSLSFEVSDTGTLAALLARLHYDYDTQDYVAGVETDLDTNVFSFTEEDVQNLIFTAGEYRAPGGTFSEAKLFPFHFVTAIGISVTADALGSVTIDAQGSLFKPIYQPYHTTRAYAGQYDSDSTIAIPAGWGVGSGTHGILAVEINNKVITDDLTWDDALTVDIGLENTVTEDDRIMAWLFELTPGTLPAMDYVNDIRFIKADRINVWLIPDPDGTADHETFDNYLRVQSVDINIDISRDELQEIAKNENGTSTFYRAPRYPLDITGQIRVLDTTLEKWAELQGKTLNDAATTGAVDYDNVLDITSWVNAKLVLEWYRYGADDPVQRVSLGDIRLTGYNGNLEVGGRQEANWDFTTSKVTIEGFDVAAP